MPYILLLIKSLILLRFRKKVLKNLHISKKSSTFASDLKVKSFAVHFTYSRLGIIHKCETRCKITKNYLNTQIIMKNVDIYPYLAKDAIVIYVDENPYCTVALTSYHDLFIVSRKFSSFRDADHEVYKSFNDAFKRFNYIVSSISK